MHVLSFHTWVIHISSVLEWMLAIAAVTLWGERRAEPEWRWLAVAMLQLYRRATAPKARTRIHLAGAESVERCCSPSSSSPTLSPLHRHALAPRALAIVRCRAGDLAADAT